MDIFTVAPVKLSKKLISHLEEKVEPKSVDIIRNIAVYPFHEAYESTGSLEFEISYEDATVFSIAGNENIDYIEVEISSKKAQAQAQE